MAYNFDEYIDRNQYLTVKWNPEFIAEYWGNPDALPMGIADMDIKSPAAVIEQLFKRTEHGIFGYEFRPDRMYQAMAYWYEDRYGWKIEQQHIHASPSILSSISVLLNLHSEEGDGVILQPPVFDEFDSVITSNKRRTIKNPLILQDGYYLMDFDDLEAKAAKPDTKIMILCNPHNPVGRVWTQEELNKVAEICRQHNVYAISDEIHGDFAFAPHQYTPYLKGLDNENAAACLSPGKTFNISGLVDAVVVLPNDEDRQQFHDFCERYQMNHVNVFGTLAMDTAYREGTEWLTAVIDYIQGNLDYIRDFLQAEDIGVSLIEPEGTYLAWFDFRKLGMDAQALAKFLAEDAGIATAPGHWYGEAGAGFARITIGCPRATVQKALTSLSSAIKRLP